jgi:hypothetical protein
MEWIKAALIRAIKTMAQGAVAMIGAGMVNVWDLDWKTIAGTVITMGILSILTSIAGLPEVESPKEYDEEVDATGVKEVKESEVEDE